MTTTTTVYSSGSTYGTFSNPVDVNTPKRLYPNQGEKACKLLIVKGIKSSRTANATTAYIGYTSVDGEQQLDLPPNEERVITPSPNKLIDPYDIFVDITTAGDGVYFQAIDVIA